MAPFSSGCKVGLACPSGVGCQRPGKTRHCHVSDAVAARLYGCAYRIYNPDARAAPFLTFLAARRAAVLLAKLGTE